MKHSLVTTLFLGALSLSTHAVSECTRDMNAEIMAECITIEGSGANYQDWSRNYKGRADTSALEEHGSIQTVGVESEAAEIQKH